jgi:GTP pyrophosphokinase
MSQDLGRNSGAALAALRYVEDFAHRVTFSVIGNRMRDDPVQYLIYTHRRIHRDGDAGVLRKAYEVAELMHRGQMRKSGEPYITHPLAVAQKVAELGMDTTTVAAALLHDTVEDTSYTMGALHDQFGTEVALLVDGVTKFEKVFYGESAEVETIRKMIIAAGADVRVLVVKLADRLHNMLTIDARSPASRSRIARATQDVLIPLCDRLGIQALKRDLEDSVLAALEPDTHAVLRSWVVARPDWRAYVDHVVGRASTVLRSEKIKARVVARPHHLYSIWKDSYGKGYEELFELPRIAIIVAGEENDCYTALGAMHSTWRPVSGRFKDFIASPKNNLYRSLHTTVIGPEEQAVEVQIRTELMDRNAEYGIVASYRFVRRGPGAHSARRRADEVLRPVETTDEASDDSAEPTVDLTEPGRTSRRGLRRRPVGPDSEHLEWLRRLVEWQRSAVDPVRFLESLRCDLSEGQVHVFVAGSRLLLPSNSTPIDVAYALKPEHGHRLVAATVNGQLAFLSSPLADGDVVEIHTAAPGETRGPDGKPIGPSAEWLTFVRTPNAQLHIEQRLGLRTASDPESAPPLPIAARVRIGRALITLELRRHQRTLATDMPLLALASQLGYQDVQSLLLAVADRVVPAEMVARTLIEQVDDAALGDDPDSYVDLPPEDEAPPEVDVRPDAGPSSAPGAAAVGPAAVGPGAQVRPADAEVAASATPDPVGRS